jgi:hypothetical protein
MCNLYSRTKGTAAIREIARAMDRGLNLPSLPGIFPDYPAPIVRNGAILLTKSGPRRSAKESRRRPQTTATPRRTGGPI